MKKLLDVTDSKTRLLQLGLMTGCGLLAYIGISALRNESLPQYAGGGLLVLAAVALFVTAGVKQRWEIEYRGHAVRFENSPITAERLYLDEGLVARGGAGMNMTLRAPIRAGEGAGEELVAVVSAGIIRFRLRILVAGQELDGSDDTASTPAVAAAWTADQADEAVEELVPVVQTTVLGHLVVARRILEFILALVGAIGGLGTAFTWLS